LSYTREICSIISCLPLGCERVTDPKTQRYPLSVYPDALWCRQKVPILYLRVCVG